MNTHEPTIKDVLEVVEFIRDTAATRDDIAAVRAEMATRDDIAAVHQEISDLRNEVISHMVIRHLGLQGA